MKIYLFTILVIIAIVVIIVGYVLIFGLGAKKGYDQTLRQQKCEEFCKEIDGKIPPSYFMPDARINCVCQVGNEIKTFIVE